jgi:fatty acid desaturase
LDHYFRIDDRGGRPSQPLTDILAVMLIGSRQLGLAILMHEGAHRCFSRNGRRNIVLSQWLRAYQIFADTFAYRLSPRRSCPHAAGKRPDLVLSAPFPIHQGQLSKILAGHQRSNRIQAGKAQFLNALGDPSWPIARRLRHCREKLAPQMTVNAMLFSELWLAAIWWAYPLLWLVPLLTSMVITRI